MATVIPENWSVPTRFRERLGAGAGAQRAMVADGHLLLILHETGSTDRPTSRRAAVFWRDPLGTWSHAGSGANGLTALRRHVDNVEKHVADLDVLVEGAATASTLREVLKQATPLARLARNLHQALQQAREGVEAKEILTLRDQAGDIDRGAELVVAQARDALDAMNAASAAEQAAAAYAAEAAQHRLNTMIALFLPATAMGSILGMNLNSGLVSDPTLFWGVAAAAIAVGALLAKQVQSGRRRR